MGRATTSDHQTSNRASSARPAVVAVLIFGLTDLPTQRLYRVSERSGWLGGRRW
jgi:hypothetical protein